MGNNRKTPAIRFKGFNDAWEQRKFEDIFEISQGLQIAISERFSEPGENRFFYITNEFLKSDYEGKYYVYNPSENVVCNKDDILMTRTGNTGIVVTDVEGCFHNNFFKIKYDKQHFDKHFICQFLSSPMKQKRILSSAGSSTIPDLSHKSFYKLDGFFPRIEEQKKISSFFINLDNLITLHQRKCDKLIIFKKAMLEKMFSKNGEKIPEVRFEGFNDAWEQRKLGDVAENFEYGLNAAATEYDGINKYIRITDIDDESRIFKKDDLTSPCTNLEHAEKYKLQEGDILFARTGASVGKSYIYRHSDGLVYYAGFLIRGKIKSEYDIKFVFQNTLTENYRRYISITSQRSGQPGVNAQEYQEYTFYVPKYDEQQKIGAFFNQLDNLITLHQRKCDKLQIVKKSMLEKMFV